VWLSANGGGGGGGKISSKSFTRVFPNGGEKNIMNESQKKTHCFFLHALIAAPAAAATCFKYRGRVPRITHTHETSKP